MSELSAREQILHHIKLVEATGIEPPAEWQRLRQRWEEFDHAVQQMSAGAKTLRHNKRRTNHEQPRPRL
jgi:hypothetical protein